MSRTQSEEIWVIERNYLQRNRYSLGRAAGASFPDHILLGEGPLLTNSSWLPARPMSLDQIEMRLGEAEKPVFYPRTDLTELPIQANGSRYRSYSDALLELAAPRAFENRKTYRLVSASLDSDPQLTFSNKEGRYFDSLDTGEACAHEFTRQRLGSAVSKRSMRQAIGDPCDCSRRPVNMAVSTLTLRKTATSGARYEFYMHWRDPKRVGHAGGLYNVVPSGVFQQSADPDWNTRPDFSLDRFIMRESAEEIAGRSEEYASEFRPIDYVNWPFARKFSEAVEGGFVSLWCLGLGCDPLTFATDLMTVAVYEDEAFRSLFPNVVQRNDEGVVAQPRPFTREAVEQFLRIEPVQAVGSALLSLSLENIDLIAP